MPGHRRTVRHTTSSLPYITRRSEQYHHINNAHNAHNKTLHRHNQGEEPKVSHRKLRRRLQHYAKLLPAASQSGNSNFSTKGLSPWQLQRCFWTVRNVCEKASVTAAFLHLQRGWHGKSYVILVAHGDQSVSIEGGYW